MKHARHIWIAFGLCLTVVIVAMGWLSAMVLRLERAEAQTQRQAAFEENVRLALWRMDSALTGVIAQENAYPYFFYSPFYPAERAYDRMFAQLDPGEVLIPSPLLAQDSPYILLHFQFAPKGTLTSPQAPAGNMLDLAEARYASYESIEAATARLRELRSRLSRDTLLGALPRSRPPAPTAREEPADENLRQQMLRNASEWQARASNVAQESSQRQAASRTVRRPPGIGEGLLQPVWLDTTLILARTVSVGKETYIQGCWLDWPALKTWLLKSIEDLLPHGALEPVRARSDEDPARMLAALPLKLVPGPAPDSPATHTSPITVSLIVAWVCVLLGASAIAVLLSGAISLSERRGAFVSAVTHELRTPLSTFRMYTEMLAEGMVPDQDKRQQYLATLHAEANRLAHLVENVLAYARLERGRTGARPETLTLRDLLDRVCGRLAEHAQRSGMTLEVDAGEDVLSTTVRTDTSAVEQVLFNLVDNACKYAASAANKVIHIGAARTGGSVALKVRDHGPGIAASEAKRLFKPFTKSAADAANSAPGVGLGLALSRRLARQMGGELYLDTSVTDGACFVLTIPAG